MTRELPSVPDPSGTEGRQPPWRHLETLARASIAFATAVPDYQRLLALVAEELARATNAACTVRLLSADGESLEPVASFHTDAALGEAIWAVMRRTVSLKDAGIWLSIVRDRKTIRLAIDPQQEQPYFSPPQIEFMRRHQLRHLLGTPLVARGAVIGGLSLARYADDAPFTDADELLVRDLAERGALAIDNGRLVQAERAAREQFERLSRALDQRVRERTEELERQLADRKRMLQDLEAAKNRAEAANRELESFSYSVAHDLRAPLRSVDGYSLTLLEECGDRLGADGQLYLERVRDSAQTMGRLIEDLLRLSRLSRTELRREPVDVSALAREALGRLAARDPGRTVEVRVEDGLWDVGDRGLLAVALDNLLANAWKFTSRRAQARIEVGAARGATTAYFVRDNGAGFDMAHAGKLFGVFERLHSSREFEGTGVGLATVQRIIQRHGGRIWAEGRQGEGATFLFTLNESAASVPVPPVPATS